MRAARKATIQAISLMPEDATDDRTPQQVVEDAVKEDKRIRAKKVAQGIHPDSIPLNPKIPGLVFLSDLKPGDRFALYHGKEWFGAETYGTLIRTAPGYCAVRLDRSKPEEIEFKKADGTLTHFRAQQQSGTSEWSRGTLVIKVAQVPRGRSGFAREDGTIPGGYKNSLFETFKEDSDMATMNLTGKGKGNAKAASKPTSAGKANNKAVEKAPSAETVVKAPKAAKQAMSEETKAKLRAKSEKKAENPCQCGCGELVKNSFKQGHDARFHGWIKKVKDGRLKLQDIKGLENGGEQAMKNVAAAIKAGH